MNPQQSATVHSLTQWHILFYSNKIGAASPQALMVLLIDTGFDVQICLQGKSKECAIMLLHSCGFWQIWDSPEYNRQQY